MMRIVDNSRIVYRHSGKLIMMQLLVSTLILVLRMFVFYIIVASISKYKHYVI